MRKMHSGAPEDLVISELLDKITTGESLSRAEAERLMELILSGELGTDQIIAVLLALRAKGETIDEVVGFATAMRRHATTIFPAGWEISSETMVAANGSYFIPATLITKLAGPVSASSAV